MTETVELARRIADEVLFPRAYETDTSDTLPRSNLDALAEAGLYGIFVPTTLGGLGADFPTTCSVVEVLASGCLATTFVWIQHFGMLGSVLGDAPAHLKESWLGPLTRGELRGGIALAGLRPGPPSLRAEPDGSDWVLSGSSPWVTGWGLIDLLQVVARGPDDGGLVYLALDADEQEGLSAEREPLVAVNASVTVRLDFEGLRVGGDRVLRTAPFDESLYLGGAGGGGLRINGSLALGVASRCCTLIGPSPLDEELTACRAQLDRAEPDEIPAARAAASEFAVRAASALVVHAGSRAVVTDHDAQRLAREAMFLLVFGTRPLIKESLLTRLGVTGGG